MPEYQNCYIAFLDLLGFKQIIKDYPCDEIITIFKEINRDFVLGVGEKVNGIRKPLIDPSEFHTYVMSDSICMYVNSEIKNALPYLVFMCINFQSRMLGLSKPHPIILRGGIVKGDIYFNGNVIFGKGVVDAYLLENNNADVPRIIMTKQTFDNCQNNDDTGTDILNHFIFSDYDAFCTLNYFGMFCNMEITNRKKEIVETYNYIQHTLASTTDNSIRRKFLYLDGKIKPYYTNALERGMLDV